MTDFERRKLGGGLVALVSPSLEREGFVAAFLDRTGGVSTGRYASLNGSYQVGDRTAAVRENRGRVASAFGLERFCVPGLVHGTSIVTVGAVRSADGFARPAELLANADGTTTRSAGIGLGAFSADCVIAIFGEPRSGRVALVHAGWRGLAAGVLQRGAALFPERTEVRVALGPAIGPCHYEVGEDVALAVAAGSPTGAVTERRNGHRYLDLVGTTRAILRAEGIRRVDDTGLCTACERDRLFSFRRDGATGRHLALAMRLAS